MSACDKDCGNCVCKGEQENLTDETEGFTWFVKFSNCGGAGSWTPSLKMSMESCATEILKSDLDPIKIVLIKKKWKDRMNIDMP